MSLLDTPSPSATSATKRQIDAAQHARQGIRDKKAHKLSQIAKARQTQYDTNTKLNLARNTLANKRHSNKHTRNARKKGRYKQNQDWQMSNNKQSRNALKHCNDLQFLIEQIDKKLNELSEPNEITNDILYVWTHHIHRNILYKYLCL